MVNLFGLAALRNAESKTLRQPQHTDMLWRDCNGSINIGGVNLFLVQCDKLTTIDDVEIRENFTLINK